MQCCQRHYAEFPLRRNSPNDSIIIVIAIILVVLRDLVERETKREGEKGKGKLRGNKQEKLNWGYEKRFIPRFCNRCIPFVCVLGARDMF